MFALHAFRFVPSPQRGMVTQAQLRDVNMDSRSRVGTRSRDSSKPRASTPHLRHRAAHTWVLGPTDLGSNSNYSICWLGDFGQSIKLLGGSVSLSVR